MTLSVTGLSASEIADLVNGNSITFNKPSWVTIGAYSATKGATLTIAKNSTINDRSGVIDILYYGEKKATYTIDQKQMDYVTIQSEVKEGTYKALQVGIGTGSTPSETYDFNTFGDKIAVEYDRNKSIMIKLKEPLYYGRVLVTIGAAGETTSFQNIELSNNWDAKAIIPISALDSYVSTGTNPLIAISIIENQYDS